MKYKWFIKLLFRNGITEYGYYESSSKLNDDVFNELMLVGKSVTEGSYRTIFTDVLKNQSLSYRVVDISSIIISTEKLA